MSRTIRNPVRRKYLSRRIRQSRKLVRRDIERRIGYQHRTDPMNIMRESSWYSSPDPWPPRPEGDPGRVYRIMKAWDKGEWEPEPGDVGSPYNADGTLRFALEPDEIPVSPYVCQICGRGFDFHNGCD